MAHSKEKHIKRNLPEKDQRAYLLDKDLKTAALQMLRTLRKQSKKITYEIREMYREKREEGKNEEILELESTTTEMKNKLQGLKTDLSREEKDRNLNTGQL